MALYTRRRTTVVGSIIRGVGAVIAVILVLNILFALLGANPGNAFVQFVANWAGVLALWFKNLFATGNAQLDLILNYGLAVIFWVFVFGLLARLVDRTG
jgi:hypothetical protein